MSYFVEAPRLAVLRSGGSTASIVGGLSPARSRSHIHMLCRSPRRAALRPPRVFTSLETRRDARWLCSSSVRIGTRKRIVMLIRPTSANFHLSSRYRYQWKTSTVKWNWMCAYLESVSVEACKRTDVDQVGFCKLISPVQSASTKLLVKSFTEKRNGRKVDLRKYN